jgi:hypothetical protein
METDGAATGAATGAETMITSDSEVTTVITAGAGAVEEAHAQEKVIA